MKVIIETLVNTQGVGSTKPLRTFYSLLRVKVVERMDLGGNSNTVRVVRDAPAAEDVFHNVIRIEMFP